MITTRTSDLLTGMAHKLQSIANAVYEAGYRDEAREIEVAAHRASIAALSIEAKIANGARAMLRDEPTPSTLAEIATLNEGDDLT